MNGLVERSHQTDDQELCTVGLSSGGLLAHCLGQVTLTRGRLTYDSDMWTRESFILYQWLPSPNTTTRTFWTFASCATASAA